MKSESNRIKDENDVEFISVNCMDIINGYTYKNETVVTSSEKVEGTDGTLIDIILLQ